MGEYQDIRRPEPPTYRGYTVLTYYFENRKEVGIAELVSRPLVINQNF